jgi:amino acid transporter
MGVGALIGIGMSASSPQSVLNGGITTMFANTGVQGAPLAFLVVGFVFALISVGYVAVSRYVPHGAPFYAQLALGFSPSWGLIAAGVALVGYNCLQISLFALIGTSAAALFGGVWWVWAAAAWVIVLVMGQYPGAANAKIIGVLLACEIGIVIAFDVAAFANPAAGTTITLDGFAPSNLLVAGGGASVLVFAAAAYTGQDSLPAYAEEARTDQDRPGRTIFLASFGGYALLMVLYAGTAWALLTALGPANLADALKPGNAPMVILQNMWGSGLGLLGTLLLLTSVLAAQSAFNGFVARYLFALARENVLPVRFLASVTAGRDGGAPKGGSIGQSLIAAVVLAGFVVSGAQPMQTMFVWLSTIGAVCVLILLTLSSWSASSYFSKGHGVGEKWLVRQGMPFVGGVTGILALFFMASNLPTMLGLPAGSNRPWLIAVLLAATTAVAVIGGAWLKRYRPGVYDGIGRGTPDPLLVKDARFDGVQL